jgi:Sulfotransferase family
VRGDPASVRARHWARWRRSQVREHWERRAHLDPLADESRAAWICSWQRSGSTLLAEVLSSPAGTRLVYEPANVPGALFRGEVAAQVPLPTGPGPELRSIEHALRGRVHGAWVDQLARGHLFTRRVVKDVRAIGLLELVAARHPATPIVVLVRHPVAVARSVVELGWTSSGADPNDALLAEVRRWTDAHAAALAAPSSHRALVVAYEHLVTEPDATLDRMLAHLASHHGTWRADVDRSQLASPSATSFRRAGPRDARSWIGSFDDLDRDVLDAATELLDAAGLGELYGAAPEPLVDLDTVASTMRRR